MIISFISPFYPFRGGIAQFGDSFYLELSKYTEVLAINYKRLYPGFLFPGSSQYLSQSDKYRNIISERLIDSINPISWGKAVSAVLEFKAEIAVLSYWMPFFAPALGSIARKLTKHGVKTIGLLHNVNAHEGMPLQKLLSDYFFKKCDHFILLNNNSISELEKTVSEPKYNVLFHPLYNHYGEKMDKLTARERLNLPKESKVILFFGFIREYKGLDILIDAMKYLDDSYILIIAGECYGDYSHYERKIINNNLKDRVKQVIRYIPESEIPLFFSVADVCVLPYRSASQSGIAGMAYHFGLPVIATDKGGLAEDVLHMKTGIVVSEANAELIAESVKKYFGENLYMKFTPEIKGFKLNRSWKNFTLQFIDLCKKLLNQN